MLCLSAPLHVCACMSWDTLSSIFLYQTFSTIWALILSCVLSELWSSITGHLHISLQEGCSPSRYPIVATSPHCSFHGKQAPIPLVSRCYCCRALGVKKGRWHSNASHFSGSRQATTVRAGVDSAGAADLWLFVTHGRAAPSFFLCSSISPPCLTPPRSFSSAELSLTPLWPQGGIQRRTAVCAGEERERQGKKSWLRALVMCSVVVAVSSRRDPVCLLRAELRIRLLRCCSESRSFT